MSVRVAGLHSLARSRLRQGRPLPARLAIRSRAKAIPAVVPSITYVICTSPRSGSWLLSDGLSSTRVAGHPREWLNMMEEQHQRALWRMAHPSDLSLADYLRLARSKSTTTNGVSGTKIHFFQFADLPRKLGRPELTPGQLMMRLFPGAKYVWLKRRDKTRQAISLAIASQTNKWWDVSGEGSGAQIASPHFDPQAIFHWERVLEQTDVKWRNFFAENQITSLVIHYEDLASDYAGTIARVLEWLGIAAAAAAVIPPPRLQRQSNAANEEWLARYSAIKANGYAPAEDRYGREVLGGRVPHVLNAVPNTWKQWIAQSKSKQISDDQIIRVLIRNGYSREAAVTAAKGSDKP
jgi:trehalose 2-sulfotransferase